MFAWVLDPELWGALLTLSALEIVLGIDNLTFLSVVVDRLPVDEQAAMREAGLVLALIFRILFLLSIVWIMTLDRPLFSIAKHAVSWRDLIFSRIPDSVSAWVGRSGSFNQHSAG